MYVWGILLHDFRNVADGSKTLKQFTENIDQGIFKDTAQLVRCNCVGENSYLIHAFCIITPVS
jgi:hypothetical protein